MDNIVIIFCVTLIICCTIFFILGYLIGKLNSQAISGGQPVSFFQKEKNQAKVSNQTGVTIDETKYVTEISTAGLEKKYGNIANTKTSDEDITSSINKLKNMKG